MSFALNDIRSNSDHIVICCIKVLYILQHKYMCNNSFHPQDEEHNYFSWNILFNMQFRRRLIPLNFTSWSIQDSSESGDVWLLKNNTYHLKMMVHRYDRDIKKVISAPYILPWMLALLAHGKLWQHCLTEMFNIHILIISFNPLYDRITLNIFTEFVAAWSFSPSSYHYFIVLPLHCMHGLRVMVCCVWYGLNLPVSIKTNLLPQIIVSVKLCQRIWGNINQKRYKSVCVFVYTAEASLSRK